MAAVGYDNFNWRITNLLVPLGKLFPSVGRIYIVDQAEAFEIVRGYRNVHPEGYSYATPKTAVARLDAPGLHYFPAMVVSDTARKIVEAYFPYSDKRRIVTITLRTYSFISARNSDIASWVEFARELDQSKYKVIFVPDASPHGVLTFGEINEFEVFDAACWNIDLRAALYSRAWMNMGVVGGPLAISGLMEHVLTIVIDRSLDCPPDYREHIHSSTGVVPGERVKFYSKSCHFHLGKDRKETIQMLFNEHAK